MAYSSIVKPLDYFNTVLYTGTGATQSITGVGFQPDFTWIKPRSIVDNHVAFDAVRGATKVLKVNLTNAESTVAQTLTSFNSDGFSIGSDGEVSGNNATYASWNWLANGQGSANTDGSINTTYTSVNTTAGFSISSYTGTGSAATVGHGLGSIPKMMIIKNRGGTQGWATYHHTQGAGNYLDLSSTNSVQAGTSIFNNTTPTSSVFSIGTSGWTNDSGNNYIAYCFAEKQGYSKFGSYTGNGNADGTFVYTGFKPAFVIRKYVTGGSASGEGWEILDSTRSPFNVADKRLKADSSGAESTGSNYYVDFLSNGFKCRTVDNATNNSGATYIYMAFAENPLVANSGTDGVPATAR